MKLYTSNIILNFNFLESIQSNMHKFGEREKKIKIEENYKMEILRKLIISFISFFCDTIS